MRRNQRAKLQPLDVPGFAAFQSPKEYDHEPILSSGTKVYVGNSIHEVAEILRDVSQE